MDRVKLFIVFLILLFALALRFFYFYQNQPKFSDGQHVSFKATLLKEPQVFSRYQRFSANINPTQEVFITVPVFSQLHYGDTVVITGTLKERVLSKNKSSTFFSRSNDSHKKKNEANPNSKQWGIEKVLDKTIMTMSYPKIEVIKDNKNLLLAISSFIREKATSLFEKTLPPTSSSLLLGIVFGVKESMPKDFSDSLRISGVFHVVAASGMNVAFVGGFLSSIFGFFLKRQFAVVCSVMGILFYAVLAGLEPSIIRASIMGILVFTGQIMGRQSLAAYGLFIAGFTMLFFSPNLIFDIGFQLSFLATLGLLYIRPLFERSKQAKVILNKSIVGEGVVTSIAAQAGVLPILVSNFGTYSLWSVIVNGLVLWTIPTLMVIGGVGAMLGMISQPLGIAFLYLSLPFLLYFQKVVSMFASFGGVVNFGVLPWQLSLSYYSFLILLILWLKKK